MTQQHSQGHAEENPLNHPRTQSSDGKHPHDFILISSPELCQINMYNKNWHLYNIQMQKHLMHKYKKIKKQSHFVSLRQFLTRAVYPCRDSRSMWNWTHILLVLRLFSIICEMRHSSSPHNLPGFWSGCFQVYRTISSLTAQLSCENKKAARAEMLVKIREMHLDFHANANIYILDLATFTYI